MNGFPGNIGTQRARAFDVANSLPPAVLEEFRTEIYRLVEVAASFEEGKAALSQLANRRLTNLVQEGV